jgi:alkylation response protein AidB-like acyl-CoA dehydrogenase
LGGRGKTLVEAVGVLETMASVSPSVALIASMPLGLAGIYGLGDEIAPETHRAAFAEQAARVAADYRAGRVYAACNSEKGAGGSLAATRTLAARQPDGGFVLSGEKILASAGQNAATFFSTAKVSADELPGAGVPRASRSWMTGMASGCVRPRVTRCATTTPAHGRWSGFPIS